MTPAAVSAGLSHPGRVRTLNEDAFLRDDRRGLWAVADGMGGHAGGAEASAMVVDHLNGVRTGWAAPTALAADVFGRLEDAHAAIRAESARTGRGPSGSTVVCLTSFDHHALVVWCGDSRVYRFRPGHGLVQVTRDHSVVQGLIDAGHIAEADAETHPQAHVLTRAVGAGETVEIDSTQFGLGHGDRLMLCTDGLTRLLTAHEIAEAMARRQSPEALCEGLVDAVLARGAPDNVTVVIVDFF